MNKRLMAAGLFLLTFGFGLSAEAVMVDVLRDGYIEDFTRSAVIPPDGVPDRLADTNALLASRGEFFDQFNAFNVDSRVIMTFDISSYAGGNLTSAYLTGYATRVDNKASFDPITGEFYISSGDGAVALADFDAPATFVGSESFQADPAGFNLHPFQVDIKNQLQPMLTNSNTYAEFRVTSPSATVFINAGEVDPASGFQTDARWPGPRLALEFDHTSAVPEPASLLLLGGGLAGLWRRRISNK